MTRGQRERGGKGRPPHAPCRIMQRPDNGTKWARHSDGHAVSNIEINSRVCIKMPAAAVHDTFDSKDQQELTTMIGSVGIFTMAVFLSLAMGCFITNCPPGGKRSNLPPLGDSGASSGVRKCARCGPSMSGRCYGPRVCCSDKLGCLVGGAPGATQLALLPCAAESLFPQPCTNGPVARCGRAGRGVCAAPGVCCTHNACETDASCSNGSPNESFRAIFSAAQAQEEPTVIESMPDINK